MIKCMRTERLERDNVSTDTCTSETNCCHLSTDERIEAVGRPRSSNSQVEQKAVIRAFCSLRNERTDGIEGLEQSHRLANNSPGLEQDLMIKEVA